VCGADDATEAWKHCMNFGPEIDPEQHVKARQHTRRI
jgi:hypothetical protein